MTTWSCANRQSDGWRSIVASVRKVFSGKLTEAAMPQGCAGSAKAPDGSTLGGQGQCAGRTDGALPGACVDGVDWWDALDIIGVVLNGTTVDDIVAQWSEYKAFAKEVSAKHDNKPVVFTEIGYFSGHCSRDHPRRRPTTSSRRGTTKPYSRRFVAKTGSSGRFGGTGMRTMDRTRVQMTSSRRSEAV